MAFYFLQAKSFFSRREIDCICEKAADNKLIATWSTSAISFRRCLLSLPFYFQLNKVWKDSPQSLCTKEIVFFVHHNLMRCFENVCFGTYHIHIAQVLNGCRRTQLLSGFIIYVWKKSKISKWNFSNIYSLQRTPFACERV